jgi:hypothetical protein
MFNDYSRNIIRTPRRPVSNKSQILRIASGYYGGADPMEDAADYASVRWAKGVRLA